MNDEYIKLENCKHGYLYKINSRNLDYGVFNEKDKGFIGIREKFGQTYLFTEYHWDTGAPYGTVTPIEEISKIPDDIKIDENETHVLDDLWAVNPVNGKIEPVVRKNWYVYNIKGELEIDKTKEESPHGSRKGFADYWINKDGKIGDRLPDEVYPYFRGNEKLFEFLENMEK